MLRRWQRVGTQHWERALTGLLEYWRAGALETTVSGNLQEWGGCVEGSVMAAPAVGQRPTPGPGGGWSFLTANLTMLAGAAAIAPQIDGAKPHTLVSCVDTPVVGSYFFSAADDTSPSIVNSVARTNFNTARVQRTDGASDNYLPFEPWDVPPTVRALGYTFTGTHLQWFSDGAAVGAPFAVTKFGVGFNRLVFGARGDSTPSSFFTGEILSQALCLGALSDVEMAYAAAQQIALYR